MSQKYIGIGSNLLNKKQNIEDTLQKLSSFCNVLKVSPVYETSPLLPDGAPGDWLKSFLNVVVEIKTDLHPKEFLKKTQLIESEISGKRKRKWEPRLIDIDILKWGDLEINDEVLVLPHPEMKKRSFVMDPLKDLNLAYHKESKSLLQKAPLWMSVINLTPDSFSEKEKGYSLNEFSKKIIRQEDLGVHIFDLGAESTRPHAKVINPKEEWRRLSPYLKELKNLKSDKKCFPIVSVDTYKVEVMEKAYEYGATLFNDVSGDLNNEKLSFLKNSEASYVLTHSLGVPADPLMVIEKDVVFELSNWLEEKSELLEKNNISAERVYFDPGLGFGKTAKKSIDLLKRIKEFDQYPYRLLVGHSRKSFMNSFSSEDYFERDIETLGVSMNLVSKGVDVIRVHNPEVHIRAMRGWGNVAG